MRHKSKDLQTWCKEKDREDILNELDSEENSKSPFPINPSKIEYNSPLPVFWKCSKNHKWVNPIVARTLFNLTCPMCNPKMELLPIGTKYGCLTIIDNIQDESNINTYGPKYKCKCDCGNELDIDTFHFLKNKHKFCDTIHDEGKHYDNVGYVCGIRTKQKEKLLQSYERVYDESYDIDYSNTVHESLEILECINSNYEKLYCYHDKRKKGGGTYKVYKLYKCRCYLCGKEFEIKSSDFSINPPTKYGYRAYDGYWSSAYCDCHKISSFQWIVAKVLGENKIPYKVEVSFPDLWGAMERRRLRYDFAVFDSNKNIKFLIECQGEQHYRPIKEFGGDTQYKMQQKNDELKREYAKKHNIKLIEIPYTHKKYEKVIEYLRTKSVI